MNASPFDRERQDSGREIAAEQPEWFDAQLCFLAGIDRMEVRTAVIVEVHPDHDAEETRNLWHAPTWAMPAQDR